MANPSRLSSHHALSHGHRLLETRLPRWVVPGPAVSSVPGQRSRRRRGDACRTCPSEEGQGDAGCCTKVSQCAQVVHQTGGLFVPRSLPGDHDSRKYALQLGFGQAGHSACVPRTTCARDWVYGGGVGSQAPGCAWLSKRKPMTWRGKDSHILPSQEEEQRTPVVRGDTMLLCKKIKIEVSDKDAEALEFMQAKCRGLCNWWIMKLRSGERWNLEKAKQSLRESKAYDPELRYVYGKLLQEVYFRLDKAMQAFFHRVAAGEKPGFPRVKPRHQFFTLCYPAMYLEVEGKTITLPTGGGHNWGPKRYPNIVAHLTDDPPEHFHEVAVSRDARGNYYCSFVYEDTEQGKTDPESKPSKQRKKRKHYPMREDGIVAFDLGIKTLATGVNYQGRFYHIGGFND